MQAHHRQAEQRTVDPSQEEEGYPFLLVARAVRGLLQLKCLGIWPLFQLLYARFLREQRSAQCLRGECKIHLSAFQALNGTPLKWTKLYIVSHTACRPSYLRDARKILGMCT